jgi:IclR family transcriptional regulator, acetate operon repressor
MSTHVTSQEGRERNGHVQSVVKATVILQAFDRQHRSLSIRQLAERTGIPRSTCHALVTTLVDTGLLERQQPNDSYRLGPALVVLGGRVIERERFQDIVHEIAASQLSSLQVEIHIAQFVGTGIVYLEKSGQAQRLANTTGRFRRLSASACGLAVLMALPKEEALRHLQDVPPSRRGEVLRDLHTQLRRGYVLTPSSQSGYLALASPVREADGNVIGAIGTADRQGAMSPRRVAALGTAFRAAALDSSRMLGYEGPKEGIFAWEEPDAHPESADTEEVRAARDWARSVPSQTGHVPPGL